MPQPWWDEARAVGRTSIGALRVAVYGSGGAPMHHAALVAHFGGTPRVLSAGAIRGGGLEDVDVIVFPGGGARAMSGLLGPLGEPGAAAIRAWVARGGMYVGSCAGAFLPARASASFWDANPEAHALHMVPAPLANASDSVWEGLTSPGVGRIGARVVATDHWLARGLPEAFALVHYNGPMFRIDPEAAAAGTTVGVAAFDHRTAAFTPSEAFLTGPASPRAVAGGTLFDRCAAEGAFTALASRFGDGTVVLFGSHPEFGFDTLQLGWGPGARLFLNALTHQAERTGGAARSPGSQDPGAAGDPRDLLERVAGDLDAAAAEAEALRARPDVAPWLEPGFAPSFLGLTPSELWQRALRESTYTARRTAAYLRSVAHDGDPARLRAHGPWLTTDAPADQDYGFLGLRPLARRIREGQRLGAVRLSADPQPLAHAYDQFGSHPFQILVGSYLSVAGVIASAALAATVVGLAAAPAVEAPTGPAAQPIGA